MSSRENQEEEVLPIYKCDQNVEFTPDFFDVCIEIQELRGNQDPGGELHGIVRLWKNGQNSVWC